MQFVTVLALICVPIINGQSVSRVALSESREQIHAFGRAGQIMLPVAGVQLDIRHSSGNREQGTLVVVYDPEYGHYFWHFNPGKTADSLLSSLEFGSAAVFTAKEALVAFNGLWAQEHGEHAESLSAAEDAAINELGRGLPVYERNGYDTGAKLTAIAKAVGTQFACAPLNSFCPGVTRFISISQEGDKWRIVLRNRFDVEVVLDSKFKLISTRRLSEPPEGVIKELEVRTGGAHN